MAIRGSYFRFSGDAKLSRPVCSLRRKRQPDETLLLSLLCPDEIDVPQAFKILVGMRQHQSVFQVARVLALHSIDVLSMHRLGPLILIDFVQSYHALSR